MPDKSLPMRSCAALKTPFQMAAPKTGPGAVTFPMGEAIGNPLAIGEELHSAPVIWHTMAEINPQCIRFSYRSSCNIPGNTPQAATPMLAELVVTKDTSEHTPQPHRRVLTFVELMPDPSPNATGPKTAWSGGMTDQQICSSMQGAWNCAEGS